MSASQGSVAVYMRVSSEEQRERQTIETQREHAEKYVAAHQLPLFDYYADDGVSGTIALDQRPQGARLLKDAKAKKFDTVLIYAVSRLGRGDARHTLNAVAELESCGVRIKSMTEPFDTLDPIGRFYLTMLASVAALDRDTIIARCKAGSERVARNGGWLGGHAPFGYRVEGKGRDARLVVSESAIPGVDLSEADVVRQMYRMAVEDTSPAGRSPTTSTSGACRPRTTGWAWGTGGRGPAG